MSNRNMIDFMSDLISAYKFLREKNVDRPEILASVFKSAKKNYNGLIKDEDILEELEKYMAESKDGILREAINIFESNLIIKNAISIR